MKNSLPRQLFILAVTIMSVSAVFAQVSPTNILFIGNSYTHYNDMPGIFKDFAIEKGYSVNVEMSAKSNHTCKMHCERAELFEKIKSKKWEYVVIQGFSRELCHEPEYLDTSFVPYFNRIVDSVYTNNSCTNVLLYLTWGYNNGIQENEEMNTFLKMGDKIVTGYQYIADLYALPIVPVGMVWRSIHLSHPDYPLYDPDNMHPSKTGSFLIASTFFSSIFKTLPADSSNYTLDEQTTEIIKNAAYKYVLTNVDRFKLRQNTADVKFERTEKGKYLVHCKSYFQNCTSIKWEFGDSTSSNLNFVSHQYKKPGTYFVKLVVDDSCGQRVIQKKVVFVAPKKSKKVKTSEQGTKTNKTKRI